MNLAEKPVRDVQLLRQRALETSRLGQVFGQRERLDPAVGIVAPGQRVRP